MEPMTVLSKDPAAAVRFDTMEAAAKSLELIAKEWAADIEPRLFAQAMVTRPPHGSGWVIYLWTSDSGAYVCASAEPAL
jgi:hypothetical protein